MTEKNQVYKCEICGNIIEVLHKGADSLVCCGQPMKLQNEKSEDSEKGEKHVPVIEMPEPDKILVKIGSVEHPMTEEHYIEWIELIADGKSYKKFLKSGDKPEAEFCISKTQDLIAKEYCNLHGLWKSEQEGK